MTVMQVRTFSLLLGMLAGTGVAIFGNHLAAYSQQVTSVNSTKGSTIAQVTANTATTPDKNFITAAVQKVGPAVVRIDTIHILKNSDSDGSQDPLSQLFEFPPSTAPKQEIEEGTGSGFIISSDGRILTNAHVVDGVKTVRVTLKDGRILRGTVLGRDPVTDVAVVKVNATQLPTVKLGNSNQLEPGEWAIAIGNPLGLDNTVTVGIISATGRPSSEIGFPNERVSYIQTDASINPGNSGGPLLNQEGEVIGMNTAVAKDARGLGFAIPINMAQQIAQQLIARGKVEHPYLGVQMLTLTPELQKQINHKIDGLVKENQGVLVVNVALGSPADKAGIKMGDVIDKVNGQSVKEPNEISQIVDQASVGSRLPLSLNRAGRSLNVTVQLKAIPVSID